MLLLKSELDGLIHSRGTANAQGKTQLDKNISAKRKALMKATRENPNNAIEAMYDEILFENGVHFHKYHGKTLTGDHCATFISRIGDIARTLTERLIPIIETKYGANSALKDEVKTRLKSVISHVSILSYVFMEICHYLYRTNPLVPEELDTFGQLCSLFGELWRRCGLNVSPKVHIVESHLNDFMRRFGRLGILTDDTMERTWPEDHLWNRVFSCILNWQKRTELIHARQVSSRHDNVQSAATIGDNPIRKSRRAESSAPPAPKRISDVMNHIKSLQDRHPFHDIFGGYCADADEMFDEIEADVERDIDHAAVNI